MLAVGASLLGPLFDKRIGCHSEVPSMDEGLRHQEKKRPYFTSVKSRISDSWNHNLPCSHKNRMGVGVGW